MSDRSPRMPRSLVSGGCVAGHGLVIPIMMFVTLAVTGPVATDPFGVERTGGDTVAAIKWLSPEQARALVAKRADATARIDTGKAALAFAGGGVSFRGALMLSSLESLDAETA